MIFGNDFAGRVPAHSKLCIYFYLFLERLSHCCAEILAGLPAGIAQLTGRWPGVLAHAILSTLAYFPINVDADYTLGVEAPSATHHPRRETPPSNPHPLDLFYNVRAH